ncbi:hypothetical protein [Pasteurella multocida]|uniref:hypothetical protein n=3 Tax=Pasteurella multocida TaxID=747 RepID=UPI000BBD395B|nr:hypothetical protein [Pasteurella multocida]ATF73894.1 hypothetical protein CO688_00220 [Pasteurella multocida]ATF73972.1 hypothetical protein CO688_00645 [Pasteurella multocida]ATN16297.1 hypothetical protein CRN72_00510 [Pasteurella multocida]ATN16373.1 hypothetical protein CRN72_00935 [Pasteurella multocida]MEB3468505.1 hypothetical protein [Pasteurella multocida]
MQINRATQKNILLKLAETYPSPNPNAFQIISDDEYSKIGLRIDFVFEHCTEKECIANLFYLQEHDLVTGFFEKNTCCNFSKGRLTHKGVDFLLDDGGLSSILGTITVKLHEDTLKKLLLSKIENADLPKEEKTKIIKVVKNLGNTALEQVVANLVDIGFENLPKLIPLLRTMSGL